MPFRLACCLLVAVLARLVAVEPLSRDHGIVRTGSLPGLAGPIELRLHLRQRVLPAVDAGPAGGFGGRVVLCVHGTSAPGTVAYDGAPSGPTWAQALARRGLDVWVLDLTGYGASTRPAPMDDPRNLSTADRAELGLPATTRPFTSIVTTTASEDADIDAAVEHLRRTRGVARVSLVGISIGGKRVLGYAGRNPDKVDRIVVQGLGGTPADEDDPPALPRSGTVMALTTAASLRARWEAMIEDPGQVAAGAIDAVWALHRASDPLGATWGVGGMRSPSFVHWGWTKAVVGAIRSPVLLIAGEHDDLATPAAVDALAPHVGGVGTVRALLAGASHLAMFETIAPNLHRISGDWLLDGALAGRHSGRARVAVDGSIAWSAADDGVPAVRTRARAIAAALPDQAPPATPDAAAMMRWVTDLCALGPHRRPGTPEGVAAEEWVADRFRDLGLADVRFQPIPISVWRPARWSLTVDGVTIPCGFMLNSGFTAEAGVSAPLVYAGLGQSADFAGLEVAGRIVVCDADIADTSFNGGGAREYLRSDPAADIGPWSIAERFPSNMVGEFAGILGYGRDAYRRARSLGAKGFVMVLGRRASTTAALYWAYDGTMRDLPGLYVGRDQRDALLAAAAAGRPATLVQTGAVTAGTMRNITGRLRGSAGGTLILQTHHDSPHLGAVEDGTGLACLFAQAWAWSRVPAARRPGDIVFFASAGHFYGGQGAAEFAAANRALVDAARAAYCVEHLGAREADAGADGVYRHTGRPQSSTIYTGGDPFVLATVMRALAGEPPRATTVERPLLDLPLTDIGGLVGTSKGAARPDGIPYASWIAAPLYLIDDGDTIERIDPDRLAAAARTVARLLDAAMAPDRQGVELAVVGGALRPGAAGAVRLRLRQRPAGTAVVALRIAGTAARLLDRSWVAIDPARWDQWHEVPLLAGIAAGSVQLSAEIPGLTASTIAVPISANATPAIAGQAQAGPTMMVLP